ncbi:MAG: carbamoyltransferase C-terminal domain-containing protein [Candidatus Hodarchaeota archaeon]
MILGIHIGHDASACLVKSGKVVRAVAEERLRGIKHWRGVPHRSIKYCLQGSNPDFIAIAGTFRRFGRFKELQKCLREIGEIPVFYWSHHLCHAASCFYTSGFNESYIVSMDAGGDGFSMGTFLGSRDQELTMLKQSSIYESLGALYSEVTASLGFRPMDQEGKTMALAAFGQPREELAQFYDEVVAWHPSYQSFVSLVSQDVATLRKNLLQHRNEYKQEDIAASIQQKLEQDVINFLGDLLAQMSSKNLCLTGGVFHNAQLALKIRQAFPEINQWIFPGMGDVGLSVGAAFLENFRQSSSPLPPRIPHVYWGPSAPHPPEKAPSGLKISKLTEYSLIRRLIELLYYESAVVGICQGELEFGPRALGHRSLLARCDVPEMKDILNQRKGRHSFQPFAPMVLHEEASKYLEDYFLSPFMTRAFRVASEMEHQIPAVIHKDKTSRVQSIPSDASDTFSRKLLETYQKETGIPFLLNTSFNLHGLPLIQNRAALWDALNKNLCDALVLGDLLIERSN